MSTSRLFVVAFALLLASSASAGVRVVGQGQGNDPTIQAAVDLALDGDVVLVRPGTYAPFTIDDKSLTVAGLKPATVTIQGTVEVKNLALSRRVVLADLAATGANGLANAAGPPGLRLSNDAGPVRVQSCTLVGGKGAFQPFNPSPGGPGMAVSGCLDVAVVGSTLRGGLGGNDESSCVECTGGRGGEGLSTATSALAFYDCTIEGGRGGDAGSHGGKGGSGAEVLSWGLFASRSTFRGGTGGDIWDFIPFMGGNGGDGLVVAAGAGVKLLNNATLGGTGGQCYLCDPIYAPSGQPTSGAGNFQEFAGTARKFATSALSAAGGTITIEVDGAPGDRVYVAAGRPDFRFHWGWHGVWLVAFPNPLGVTPLGTIGSSGTTTVTLSLPPLPPGTEHRQEYLQGAVIDLEGQTFIASPLHVTRLACASLLPDCDGDGTFDGCEFAFGSIVDLDANGVEDSCEPDCNGNGVVDALDVSSHTSADLNANQLPDECEPAVATWYVDPAAAPGGDGSSTSPFQNLSQASFAALGGHTIVLRDGTYGGASNRNFVFNSRNLVIRSANGPAGCVIDLQAQGRAFSLTQGETAAARIEGLTIRNGRATTALVGANFGGAIRAQGSAPTIVGCVFEQNTAVTSGGALYLFSSPATVRDCVFRANGQMSGSSSGGAVYASGASPHFVGCTFRENQANVGGALTAVPSGPGLVLSHCVFHRNTAVSSGGAVQVNAAFVVIENCLLTENRATHASSLGGAIHLSSGGLVGIACSTFARNTANLRGGAINLSPPAGGTLRNSILWDNVAPNGAQIALHSTTTTVANLAVAYCDVMGGASGVDTGTTGLLSWNSGNVEVAPQFVDQDGADDDPLTFDDNDWRLSLASACIDAGDNALVALDWGDIDSDGDTNELAPLDLDRAPRWVDVASTPDTGNGTAPIVDIGCFERAP